MKKVWILYYNNQDESYENTRLVQAFADQNIEARVLRPKLFDIVVSRNSEKSILYEGKRVSLPDLVLTRTGAGSNYFTLAVMRQFEKFGVPVINDADGILKVKDKLMTSQILASNGIPIPKTMLVNFPVDTDVVQKEIGYPCVVKVVSGSKGRGVYLCHSKREFKDLMELLENLKIKPLDSIMNPEPTPRSDSCGLPGLGWACLGLLGTPGMGTPKKRRKNSA